MAGPDRCFHVVLDRKENLPLDVIRSGADYLFDIVDDVVGIIENYLGFEKNWFYCDVAHLSQPLPCNRFSHASWTRRECSVTVSLPSSFAAILRRCSSRRSFSSSIRRLNLSGKRSKYNSSFSRAFILSASLILTPSRPWETSVMMVPSTSLLSLRSTKLTILVTGIFSSPAFLYIGPNGPIT